jgi:hypothetical protein
MMIFGVVTQVNVAGATADILEPSTTSAVVRVDLWVGGRSGQRRAYQCRGGDYDAEQG